MKLIQLLIQAELSIAVGLLFYLFALAVYRTGKSTPKVRPTKEIVRPHFSETLACSLEVRQAQASTECCLLKSKASQPLKGGALPSRIRKLRRLGVWL